MADRIESFDVSIPAGSSLGTGHPFTFNDGDVTAVSIRFPDGCLNLVTVQLFYASGQVIPKQTPGSLFGNNETFRFELDNYPTGQGWSLLGVNGDKYAHTITVAFEVDELDTSSEQGLPPIILMPGG